MGILEDLLGSGQPVTPGLLDAAGYMDPAQYDRARRSSAMDGLWAGLLAGGAPSLTPRNFFSALGTGMQGRQQYATDFDKDQLASSQAAAQRALIPQRQLELEQKRDALKLVGEKLPQLLPGYGGAGGGAAAPGGAGGAAAPGGAAGAGGAGAGTGSGGGGRGGWGPHADVAIATLKEQGFSDAAIQGIMANGLGEGGFAAPWVAGDNGSSRGHWQFHEGGEMAGYLAFVKQQGGDPQDTRLQTLYAAKRAEEVHPGFSKLEDPKLATDIFATKFERYKGAAPGDRYGHLADAQRYIGRQPVEERQPIPEVGTRSLDPNAAININPAADGIDPSKIGPNATGQTNPVPPGPRPLGSPVPAAIAAGVPPSAPAPGATTPDLSAYVGGTAIGPKAPLATDTTPRPAPAAGRPQPGDVVNGLVFKGGDPKNLGNWQVAPRGSVTPGQGAALGSPDTVVAAGPPQPGLNGVPVGGAGAPAMQLAALVSGGAGGQLRPGAAPGGDTVVPPGPLPAAPATPAPAPAATQPPAGTLVPGAMPATPTPADQTIVPRPDPVPQPGIPERPTLTPAPAARPLPALPPAPGLTAPDFSQVGQAVPADVARRAGIALQVGLGLKILGLDVPAISKIAELPLELQKTAYEAAVKAPYELRNTQYQSLLNMNTEQWKNLSENDRTLWSAALGLDKTEFEARIRQSEKGVEEQNKQINQNWANMTDAEKAKAAASNQFANTKFQAEMEQYGKWNSPTEVKEYDPVSGAVRVRTSTPAMEYQREVARTGGPQALTVGQALQTPGAQQGPAPAPGATQPPPGTQPPAQNFAPAPVPGATPIPLQQPGQFIRGEPGTQRTSEAQSTGAALGNLRVDYQKQAGAAATTMGRLDTMIAAAPQVALKGPLAPYGQSINRIINTATGGQADRVAAYELVTNNAEQAVRDAVHQSDSQPAAIQLSMTRESMAGTRSSEQGFYEKAGEMRGTQEWIRYRSAMADAYSDVRGTMSGFDNWLPVSPHAFMLVNMPKEYVDRIEKQLIDNGRRDEARALHNQFDLIKQWRGGRGQ